MTVLLEKRRLIVSPGLAPAQLREEDKFGRPQHADVDLTIGLVNNMPDAALQATERAASISTASRCRPCSGRRRRNGASTDNIPTLPISTDCRSMD
jgi:hypothetical protein